MRRIRQDTWLPAINFIVGLPPERFRLNRRHIYLILPTIFLLAASISVNAAPVAAPAPADIAARLSAHASVARHANQTLHAYLLYVEAAKLDPLNTTYRQDRDGLEPVAKLLLAQKLENSDIKAEIETCRLEATPGSDASVAFRLADKAESARKAGQSVLAYLLYSAAAERYPSNPLYRENRDLLAPVAHLLQNPALEGRDITADIKAAELESLSGHDPHLDAAGSDFQADNSLADLPHIAFKNERHDFDLHGDAATLIQQVTSVYGIKPLMDRDLPKAKAFSLQITNVDFRGAMDALTVATNTFVFPVSSQIVFFAEDTEAKRSELEPSVLLTVNLPNALNEKDLIDVSNGVRSVMNLRSFGWDSVNHTVLIRDRFTRAHVAKALLESLLIPHAQVALELQFVTLDSDTAYQWGLSPQTSFQLLSPATKLFNFNAVLPMLANAAQFIGFGGGLSTLGIGVTSAQLLATYSNSIARVTYDATVVVDDGQTTNLHVGEKYPIPQALYAGAAKSPSSIYNPIGTFTQEDLGLLLKVTPHVKGSGEVAMDIEAEYKALGALTLNTVPSVSQRKFAGSVVVRQDEWAVIAGMDQNTLSRTRSGLAGLTNIPGLNQLVSGNTHERQVSDTLIVLKPVIKRLPMSDAISPQFLVGPIRGVRVLL